MIESRSSRAEKRSWMEWTADIADRLAFAVSPQWGASRMATRKAWSRYSTGRYHDGVVNDRLQGGRWLGSKISPDGALEADLADIREHSHELYRTDSLGGMVDMFVDHIVNQGFTINAKIKGLPGISDEAAEGFNREIEALIERWQSAVDVSRLESWWEVDRLAARHLLVDGEAFIVMSAVRDDSQMPIPLVLEVVDPERVETPPDKSGDQNCRMGIQYDSSGKRIIGYWIRSTHPHDTKNYEFKYQFVGTDRCLHVIEKWFTKQSRGYPWMTRILRHARDGKDIHEAGLVTEQTQACLSVWVQVADDPILAAGARSTGNETNTNARIQNVQPGSVNYIGTNEKPLFMTPTGSSRLETLLRINDHRIAAGLNAPYEFLTRNWDGVSFAGGRLVLNGAKISVGIKQKMLALRLKSPIYREIVREGVLFGALEFNPTAYNRRPWTYQRHSITPPLWGYAITPGEEVDALKEAVDNNFISHEAAAAQFSGSDFNELIPQRGKELEAQRKANCLPETRAKAETQKLSPQGAEGIRNA